MKSMDKLLLNLQFNNRIFKSNGKEFQTFFEDIMSKAYPDFDKVKPVGRKGDKGSDGMIRSSGTYFQVYSPENPTQSQTLSNAALKAKKDFKKLYDFWDEINPIKTYYFVYNDKDTGTNPIIEGALAELKGIYSTITFLPFYSKNLSEEFFKLDQSNIMTLGFITDSRSSFEICQSLLDDVIRYFEMDNIDFACNILNASEPYIRNNDGQLLEEYEVLFCRYLIRNENIDEAIQQLESFSFKYPNNSNFLLYLAGIYLSIGEYEKNANLINQAESIDPNFWLLIVSKLNRATYLNEVFDISTINIENVTKVKYEKSSLLRSLSAYVLSENNVKTSLELDSKAIKNDPESLFNRLHQLQVEIVSKDFRSNATIASSLLKKIEIVEQFTRQYGVIGDRSQMALNSLKVALYIVLKNYNLASESVKMMMSHLFKCYFDNEIDLRLVSILPMSHLEAALLDDLIKYLIQSSMKSSFELNRLLIIQFCMNKNLLTSGKSFFYSKQYKEFIELIDSIEQKDAINVAKFYKNDFNLYRLLIYHLYDFPLLKKSLIDLLPLEYELEKNLLLLELYHDEKQFDQAFPILRKMDIKKIPHTHLDIFYNMLSELKAYELLIPIIDTILVYEDDPNKKTNLLIHKLSAYIETGDYIKTIELGKSIILNKSLYISLNINNKYYLRQSLIISLMKRNEYVEAKSLLEYFSDLPPDPSFLLNIQVELLIECREVDLAVKAIIDGVKILGVVEDKYYLKLAMYFMQIDSLRGIDDISKPVVSENCFVKLSGITKWYFLGEVNSFDAIQLKSGNEIYNKLIDKQINSEIDISSIYQQNKSLHTILKIFSVEQYIHFKSYEVFNQLGEEGSPYLKKIDLPPLGKTVDPQFLIRFFKDERQHIINTFEHYCKNHYPLFYLCMATNDIVEALDLIVNENKGHVYCNEGTQDDMLTQMKTAESCVNGANCYIDGISAFILADSGLLEKVTQNVPNLIIPQSVINYFLKLESNFTPKVGSLGRMGYQQGRILISNISEMMRSCESIRLAVTCLESKKNELVSSSTRINVDPLLDKFDYLADAFILASNNLEPIITDDYLVKEMYEVSGKTIPYCSTLSLIRVLCMKRIITIDDYLSAYEYLIYRRFHFIDVTMIDLEIALLGNRSDMTVNPQRLKRLHLDILLSEEYGTDKNMSLLLVTNFILNILVDDTLKPDIFIEAYNAVILEFPHKGKADLNTFLLTMLKSIIKMKYSMIEEPKLVEDKLRMLNGSVI